MEDEAGEELDDSALLHQLDGCPQLRWAFADSALTELEKVIRHVLAVLCVLCVVRVLSVLCWVRRLRAKLLFDGISECGRLARGWRKRRHRRQCRVVVENGGGAAKKREEEIECKQSEFWTEEKRKHFDDMKRRRSLSGCLLHLRRRRALGRC